jgi:quercetin dioxygenase-like cupin family protein
MNEQETRMSIFSRHTGLAACAALAALAGPAFAGECPADKVGVNVTKPTAPEATTPKGVTDTVLSAIDLAKTETQFAGYQIRIRKLTIEPGGVVPWHSHSGRPSNIYIISGGVTEYRSSCAVPIEHREGEVIPEFGEISHWWRNNTDKTMVLISADLFHAKMKDDHAM